MTRDEHFDRPTQPTSKSPCQLSNRNPQIVDGKNCIIRLHIKQIHEDVGQVENDHITVILQHELSLQCTCKLNRHRHFSVRVCPAISQTCLKACQIGNFALILRDPRYENWRFWNPTVWVKMLAGFKLRTLGPKICRQMPTRCRQIRVLDATKCIITNQMAVNFSVLVSTYVSISQNQI